TFILRMERKVDNQVAAPAETRTPNLHRAKIAHRKVRMEGWRQCWRLGRREKSCLTKKQKNPLDSDRSSHGRPSHSKPPYFRSKACLYALARASARPVVEITWHMSEMWLHSSK